MTIEVSIYLVALNVFAYGGVGSLFYQFLLWMAPREDDGYKFVAFWFALLWPVGLPIFFLIAVASFVRWMILGRDD